MSEDMVLAYRLRIRYHLSRGQMYRILRSGRVVHEKLIGGRRTRVSEESLCRYLATRRSAALQQSHTS